METRLFLPTPSYLFVPPHTKCENTILFFFYHFLGFEIINLYSGLHNQKLIFRKIFGLCTPKANNTSEKKVSGLHNSEANLMYRKDFRIT